MINDSQLMKIMTSMKWKFLSFQVIEKVRKGFVFRLSIIMQQDVDKKRSYQVPNLQHDHRRTCKYFPKEWTTQQFLPLVIHFWSCRKILFYDRGLCLIRRIHARFEVAVEVLVS